jgi:hypothetical protein
VRLVGHWLHGGEGRERTRGANGENSFADHRGDRRWRGSGRIFARRQAHHSAREGKLVFRLLGILFVSVWAWDEAAVRLNVSTGKSTIPFLWGGLIPGSAALSKYFSEVYLMAVGFILIVLSTSSHE